MADPNSPTDPPPTPKADSKPSFFDEMRAALPEAHRVSLEQAFLDGRLAQEKADELRGSSTAQEVAAAIDKVASLLAAASPYFDAMPEPLRTILRDAQKAVDVADKALAPLGL